MKPLIKIGFIILAFVAIFFTGCNKDESKPVTPKDTTAVIPASVIAVNKFIKDNMDIYYLWNNKMPALDYTKQPDPEKYFDSLLYKVYDRWSFITDDYQALANSYQGVEESFGHLYILYKYSNSNGVFGIVQYVYPNTPASEAGLVRGDLFTAIDGTDLNIDNYSTLLDKKTYTLTVAKLQGNTVVPYKDVKLTAREINQNPILVCDTLNINGKIIGYMAYKNFLDNYNDSLTTAFNWLKNMNINDLVIDLRYNNGGAISSMQHLASLIAPQVNVTKKDIIITDQYNSILTNYYNSEGISTSTRFEDKGVNLNMKSVYILTQKNTASASEALIVGLKPYMSVTVLGDTTYGKYTGAFLIYDTEKKINWAIQPIVFKYANASGYTDFVNGLAPDYLGDDDLFTPLGDPNEGLLAKAIEKITGKASGAPTKSAQIKLKGIPIKSYDGLKVREEIPLLDKNFDKIK
jgi:carboxyl-terminal processing protease